MRLPLSASARAGASLAALLLVACGSRTSLDLGETAPTSTASPSSNGGTSSAPSDDLPYCALGEGPVSAPVSGDYSGHCPSDAPYCVPIPGQALFGCCPTPQGQAQGCSAPIAR